jgi:hypothetical protein
MNKKVFILMTSFALALFSCSNDTNAPAKEEKGTDELSVIKMMTTARTNVAPPEGPVIFTGDHIELYNAKTKRIVFKNLTYDDLFRLTENNSMLAFYMGEEFLFDVLFVRQTFDATYDEPVLIASRGDEFNPDKFFLTDGYPYMGTESFLEKTPGWGKFIQYLSDAEKLEDVPDPVNPVVPKDPDEIISAFTGDDIQSFNITTREIVFVNLNTDDIYERRAGLSSKISFYLGERLLFEPPVVLPVDNRIYNDLVFTYFEDKFYLSNGYGGQSEKDLQIREANAQKRKAEWDAFIKYLSDSGKIVR